MGVKNQRYTIEEAREAFEEAGYTLVDTEYTNNRQSLRYICPLHGEQRMRLGNLLSGRRCRRCSHTTHDSYYTRLYRIYYDMSQRCYNEKTINYKDYGGRGIKVCDEWKEDFVKFRDWALNNGYQDNLSIDRIDNNGSYEPSNCRWATIHQQLNNKRNNVSITKDGKTQTIAEWSRETGINDATLRSRYRNGIKSPRILEPVHRKGGRNNVINY